MSNNRHAGLPQPPVVDLDLAAVRAFVAVTDERYFSEAAARLGISQQAISKRIAKLESDLGVRLFTRTRTGADLTDDGQAFLHQANALISIADQSVAMLHARRSTLRIDVLDTRLGTVDLMRAFYDNTPGVDVALVASNGLRSMRGALIAGSVDAAFARVFGELDEDLVATPAYLEPLHVLVDRDHPLASLSEVPMERLRGETVWMPGNEDGSEWEDYYRVLGETFGVRIDRTGPDFGWNYFVLEIVRDGRIGFAGSTLRLPWHPRSVQVPVVDPAPAYPCSLIYHRRNHHPVLRQLVDHVTSAFVPLHPTRQWVPEPDRLAFTRAGT